MNDRALTRADRRGGPITFAYRRPGLSLSLLGIALLLLSLVNFAILRFEDPSSSLYSRGMFGWSTFGTIPLPFVMFSGMLLFGTGMTALIAAAYLSGPRTKSRLFGCALVGLGISQIGAALYFYMEPHQLLHGPLWPALLPIAIGVILLRRSVRTRTG